MTLYYIFNNQINFEPTLGEVAYVVSDVLPSITHSLKSLPRLLDKFHTDDIMVRPFYHVIEEDYECQRLQSLLNNGNIFFPLIFIYKVDKHFRNLK